MKYLIVLFSSLLSSLSVLGQPDTLYLTIEQKKTFETILASFQKRQMDVDQIYMENERFDSLIRVIDKIKEARRYKLEDLEPLYQRAKKIYPQSWYVLSWENPTGCFFTNDIIERTQSRLNDYSNLCRRLRESNEFGLTDDQLNQIYLRQMDNYLSTLQYSLYFIDMNLEGRLCTHLYFTNLEKVYVSINNGNL